MIDIYLNPANEMIFSSCGETDYKTTPQNIQCARALIEELSARGADTSILECNGYISEGTRPCLEQCEKVLKGLLSKNKDYVPALVTLGLVKFIQKKSSDARNYLKTVLKNDFQLAFASYFETAWLLMADYNISVNKYDLAEGELKKVLKYNKSNVKAEESAVHSPVSGSGQPSASSCIATYMDGQLYWPTGTLCCTFWM